MVSDLDSGDVLANHRIDTPDDSHPRAVVELLTTSIRTMISELNAPSSVLRAVGVAIPGQVDDDQGRVIFAGNLRAWVDIPLRDLLEAKLGVPVWIEQDANAAALGERWRGAARDMNNFVFLALGTGIGAGIVVNGRLHRGYRDAAGEIGNFVIDRTLLGRARGTHGSLEQLIGGPALRARFQKVAGRELNVDDAFAVAHDNKRMRDEIERFHDFLAMTVISVSALLDPQAIIFGGGASAAGHELIDPVRERLERELRVRPAVIQSALGEDAQLHGAVFGALWTLDPSLALREDLR